MLVKFFLQFFLFLKILLHAHVFARSFPSFRLFSNFSNFSSILWSVQFSFDFNSLVRSLEIWSFYFFFLLSFIRSFKVSFAFSVRSDQNKMKQLLVIFAILFLLSPIKTKAQEEELEGSSKDGNGRKFFYSVKCIFFKFNFVHH